MSSRQKNNNSPCQWATTSRLPNSGARRKVALDHRHRIDRSQFLCVFFWAVPPQSCFVIAPGVVCEPAVPLGIQVVQSCLAAGIAPESEQRFRMPGPERDVLAGENNRRHEWTSTR